MRRSLTDHIPYSLDWRFTFLDGPIHANRLILANRFRVPDLNPFLQIALRGVKVRMFEANRSHVMKIGFFCESIRANRPDSRCELPGHLRLSHPSIIVGAEI